MINVSGYTYHNSEVEVKGITYQDFYLYNKDTTEIKENISSQKTDSLTNTMINACRINK